MVGATLKAVHHVDDCDDIECDAGPFFVDAKMVKFERGRRDLLHHLQPISAISVGIHASKRSLS
jgi:hypothetical protein